MPHEITTKVQSVKLYRQTKDIGFVCRRYHISKASLMRWNKQYDGTKGSLAPKSHRPHSPHPNAHTETELDWIRNLHRRNPNISVNELYGKLRQQKAYSRHPGSLYRVFIRLGFRKKVESTKKKSKHNGHYDTPKELGIKWQMDVKYVPAACYVGTDGEKFYQYTIERFIYAYKEQSSYSTVDFVKRAIIYFGYEEGWYQKGLEEERRRKEEAEAKERNEVPCITLAELEEIRKGAYDDGFAEGKKEGFAKGHEDGLASGHGEGLKSGHDEGYQAGIADGAAAVDAEKAKFAALAEKLGKPLELVNESIEKELLVVVSRIARAFLEKEARVPEFLAKSLHAAVAALPSTKEGVTVMLNPADAAELLKLMPEESLSDLGWKVVSDASVGAGDIRIDSGSSSVDWKLSERIDAVIERVVNENSGGNG